MDNQLATIDESNSHVLNAMDSINSQEMDIDIESIRNEIIGDETQESFSCYLIQEFLESASKVSVCHSVLEKHLSSKTADQQEQLFRKLLQFASTIENHTRMKWLFDVFHKFLQSKSLSPRMVCENIINCDKLTYDRTSFWILSFELILTWISNVDYKGVREIVKACFKKAHSLPIEINSTIMPQVNILQKLIETIFNRENCLLPAYFVINEIRKLHTENRSWPHWKLSALMAEFVKSFRYSAQMVSIIGHTNMLPVVEHSGYGDHFITPWKLDPLTLKFNVKGNIPYDKSLLEPQTKLLRYVLEQPYSRDMVCSMLGLQKNNKQQCATPQHCAALEEQLVELLINAMERVESKTIIDQDENHWLWLHLSSQLIYFILFQFVAFHDIVNSLHSKLMQRDLRKGRDHLMWVLLQFISGSIQRKPLDNFLPVLKLYDLLYPETEPLPVPDINNTLSTHQMAVTCIWIHLLCKAQTEKVNFQRSLPNNLKAHYEFLQTQVSSNTNLLMGTDYRIALLCNAYSTNNEYLTRPMTALVEAVLGPQRGNQQQSSVSSSSLSNNSNMPNGPITPLSMAILDSLTIHAKMSLIHRVVTHFIQLAQSKSNKALAPALIETYSRLLVYTEIESLGIKGFISQLLPTVFKSHAWGILYTLLEMFSYRMHHIQPHYRVQLLSHLHSLAAVPQTNQTQLHLCVESTALRLITGLGNNEVQPQLSRFLTEPKTLVSAESEELNRALVLTLARSMHITGTGTDAQSGNWCNELLKTIMQNTPHNWAPHTLRCFPTFLSEYFLQNAVQKENHQELKKSVEEEYRNWTSMTNDNDIIAHFSVPGTPPLFLCLLWKMILDTDKISPIAYKILERIGARALSAHLRRFCDYLVKFVSSEESGQNINKCVDAINCMIWKYNIVTIDRLVLCLVLRTQETTKDAQVCFVIIQLLLLKSIEFRARVQEFVNENSPDHWNQSNWHEKHLAFHRKYPETFVIEEPGSNTSSYQTLPVYFGNICLRFLPVFDIVIHRCLDSDYQAAMSTLETLLQNFGSLYKFHDRPITYLYNTLHYYERRLQNRSSLTKRLVNAILSPFCEYRAHGWSLSEQYQQYMQAGDNCSWKPDLDYYVKLIQRLVDTISGKIQFTSIDWRFNEFPNPAVYALYMTCVELMALPSKPPEIADNILNIVMVGYPVIPSNQIQSWINCIGLVMSALPDSYWLVLHERLGETIKCSSLQNWQYIRSPFDMFNFIEVNNSWVLNKFVYILAIAHAMWHHAGVGQISAVPQFVKEKLTPLIRSEEQYIFLCHLIGPFLPRYNVDRPSPCIMDLTVELFTALDQVNSHNRELKYIDPICDLLYHIKYQFVGDLMRNEVEGIIRNLRPSLQMRLRFIAHLNINEIPK